MTVDLAEIGFAGATRGDIDAMRMMAPIRGDSAENRAWVIANVLRLGPRSLWWRIEISERLQSDDRRARHRHILDRHAKAVRQIFERQAIVAPVGRRMQ